MFEQVFINGIFGGAVYALVAVGYALVYSVLRLVNFAHGGIVTLGAFSALAAATLFDGNLLLMGGFTLLVGGVAGWVLERVAYRPIRRASPLTALVTGLGVAMVIENVLAAAFGYDARTIPPSEFSSFVWAPFGLRFTNVQLLALFTACTTLALTWFVVRRLRIGRAIRAIADDRELASLSGISADRTIAGTFVIASMLGAVAGFILALDVGADPFMGTPIGFKAFVACVAGGNRLAGAALGGLALGAFESLASAYLSTEYRDAIVMISLISLLVIRPYGLLSTSASRSI